MATIEEMKVQLAHLLAQLRATSDAYDSARLAQEIAQLTKGYERLAYRVQVPDHDPIDYSPDLEGLRQAKAYYMRVKDAGGKWYEVQRGFDGIVRENAMPEM